MTTFWRMMKTLCYCLRTALMTRLIKTDGGENNMNMQWVQFFEILVAYYFVSYILVSELLMWDSSSYFCRLFGENDENRPNFNQKLLYLVDSAAFLIPSLILQIFQIPIIPLSLLNDPLSSYTTWAVACSTFKLLLRGAIRFFRIFYLFHSLVNSQKLE